MIDADIVTRAPYNWVGPSVVVRHDYQLMITQIYGDTKITDRTQQTRP